MVLKPQPPTYLDSTPLDGLDVPSACADAVGLASSGQDPSAVAKVRKREESDTCVFDDLCHHGLESGAGGVGLPTCGQGGLRPHDKPMEGLLLYHRTTQAQGIPS